jgi:alkylated DNA repair dioxygenase AlkB
MECPKGLYFTPNIISLEKSQEIWELVEKGVWRDDLQRHTQQYGARYDYKSRKLIYDVAPISHLQSIVDLLAPHFQSIGGIQIQQIIVNKYTKGQKIGAHSDSAVFGPVIMSLTLGDAAIMVFKGNGSSFSIPLTNGSLIGLTGEARSPWTHELESLKGNIRIYISVRSIN